MRTYPNNYVEGRFTREEAVSVIDSALLKLGRDSNAPFHFTADDFVGWGVNVEALAQRIAGIAEIPALNDIAVVIYKGVGDVAELNRLLPMKTITNGYITTKFGVLYDNCTGLLPSGRSSRKMRRPVGPAYESASQAQ
jgi:hypothetical protein